MNLEDLKYEYDQLQVKYGEKSLDSIYFGGCTNHPDIAFVFMNPTGRVIASNKNWKGLKAPWIGTKNIWDLFYRIGLLDDKIYQEIRSMKGKEWSEDFAFKLYQNVTSHKYFITNLGKCTQIDARALPDSVYEKYLSLFLKEVEIVQPKVIVLFGNQVSSIVLDTKISVSQCRKQCFEKVIGNKTYLFYPVFYPVGNGRFNMDKAVEDISWIIKNEV